MVIFHSFLYVYQRVIMVNKGNHPQMALIQVEESLVGP